MQNNTNKQDFFDYTIERNRWLAMDIEFRRLIAKDICDKAFYRQNTLKLQDRLGNQIGAVVTHKIESDPFEAKRAYSHLVTGLVLPYDFGVRAIHLHDVYKSFLEDKAKGTQISVMAFINGQEPKRFSI